jgi:hypothetical protein
LRKLLIELLMNGAPGNQIDLILTDPRHQQAPHPVRRVVPTHDLAGHLWMGDGSEPIYCRAAG